MPQFSRAEISQRLAKLEGWKLYRAKAMQRKFHLRDFKDSVKFIHKIARIAEHEQHHPDIILQNFSEVVVRTITHSEDALTNRDFELARKINREYDKMKFGSMEKNE